MRRLAIAAIALIACGPASAFRYCVVTSTPGTCVANTGAVLVEHRGAYYDSRTGKFAMTVPSGVRGAVVRYKSGPLNASEGIMTPVLGVGSGPQVDSPPVAQPAGAKRTEVGGRPRLFDPVQAPMTNVRTGEALAPAGAGHYVGTRDGRLYAPAGPAGVIDTRTGQFIPTH